MRRAVCCGLLATLLGQSSGASALAAPGPGGSLATSVGAILASVGMPVRNAWSSSELHAALTGQLSRYDAMHAPRPSFPRVIRIATAPYAGREHEARLERRSGSATRVPGRHAPRAVDPRTAPRDPMAMRRSTLPGAPTGSLPRLIV